MRRRPMLRIPSRSGTMRFVSEVSKDKITSDEDVLATLLKVFRSLFMYDFQSQRDLVPFLPEDVKLKYEELLAATESASSNHPSGSVLQPADTLCKDLGFSLLEGPSTLAAAGTGVFISEGVVPRGAVVSMYPGTIYQVYEPIFFQSIGNPFIFRCIDGILIDGNDKGISKCVYRSCSRRDQLGPFKLSDVTWLTPHHRNPLAVGQYVNNCSNDREANVCYQELEVPEDFPIELRQYIPNIKYSHDVTGPLRCVVLVALRDIQKEEELFSNYYTIVH
ncbi:SET domain-containing protein 9 isoform X2 [Ambystoma mexicanum]|uniref:SET domain-containing protein 9 isoform X2 n=1 Tax=Ambystoma mexicanum TaxID=8296 RepID=UPI0037E78CD4